MDFQVYTIKAEPCDDEYQRLSIDNEKLEIKSEVKDIVEIDESIFFQGSAETPKEANEAHICNTIEDVIMYDEIVKEEPVFYDPSQSVVLKETRNVNKKFRHVADLELHAGDESKLEKIYECYICRYETGSIGLLKWHLEERHSIERGVEKLLPKKHKYLKTFKLPSKAHSIQPKENSSKKDRLKEKSFKKDSLKKNRLERRNNAKKKNSEGVPLQKQSMKEFETHTQSLNNQDKSLECNQCLKKFGTLQRLEKHQRIHTNQKPFQCSICLKTYNSQISFKIHKRIHTGEKPHNCSKCEMKFRLKSQLDRHLRAHINGLLLKETQVKIIENIVQEEVSNFQMFECYLCPFDGPKTKVWIHMKDEHFGEKLWRCKICSKKFLLERSVDSHMRIHTKSKEFECHICGKLFARKDALNIHLQYHTGDFPYECKYCPKKFSKLYSLKTHVRSHTGFKPFECEVCKKGFVKRSDMVRHSRTHTGERPFKCDTIC